MPLVVGAVDPQGQHAFGVGGRPPCTWQFESLLHNIAVCAFYLARANRQPLADGPLVVQLVLALTEVTPALAHGSIIIGRLRRLQVRVQIGDLAQEAEVVAIGVAAVRGLAEKNPPGPAFEGQPFDRFADGDVVGFWWT